MPTDLQIIDGFERLRAEFIEFNPSAGVPPAREQKKIRGDSAPSLEEALDAWLRAAFSLNGSTGQSERWIRSLIKLLANADADLAEAEKRDSGFAPLLKKNPKIIRSAGQAAQRLRELSQRDGHRIRFAESPANPAAEAVAWSKALPLLTGLKAWRMLQHLGRDVIVPDPQLRRFFWRLGLIEDEPDGASRDLSRVAAAIEQALRLTSLPIAEMERLIEWHTRQMPGFKGGGRCGAKPHCEGCPMLAGCTWGKYAARGDLQSANGTAPRESSLQALKRRWEEHEPGELDESELLAALLLAGRAGGDSLDQAEELLRRFGGLRGLELASVEELSSFRGIGETRARQIKSALELGRRLSLEPLRRGDPITASREVWLAFRDRYRHIAQEHFIVLLLDTKNRLIQTHIVSKGTLNGSHSHPREVFKQAVRQSASGVILMHNHPSGDPEPSPEDLSVTERLSEAGQILGIRVLDHIILGNETYYSFRDSGNL